MLYMALGRNADVVQAIWVTISIAAAHTLIAIVDDCRVLVYQGVSWGTITESVIIGSPLDSVLSFDVHTSD
jgi:hypothetical protein